MGKLASHAGVFRGARIFVPPRISFVGREEIRTPLKSPAWEAMGKPTRSINYNERSGFKYLRLCVSKWEVFTP